MFFDSHHADHLFELVNRNNTVLPIHNSGYDGSAPGGGYQDYNRGGGDFGGRNDFGGGGGGGYNDRAGYGQNSGNAAMGYTSSAPMSGYGPSGGAGYGPSGAVDYGRNDYNRPADFGARTDYGNRGEFQSTN